DAPQVKVQLRSRLTRRGAPASDGSGNFFDLAVFQLDRGRAAEDRDRDAKARPLLVDLLDRAVEAGERAVGDAHGLADLEGDGRLRPLDTLFDGADDAGDLALGNRHRLRAAAEEAGHFRGVLDEV